MLFNSYTFIFLFLPVTLTGFALLNRLAPRWVSLAWLAVCSLFYYGWWDAKYLALIGFSIFFNYGVGVHLSGPSAGATKPVLISGVLVNLLLLGYFKYANFFVETVDTVFGLDYHIGTIVLPLAISFFTFQQIAYLVDAYRGETREYNFIDYTLFVTFFPQLIAGPIVHHKEMLPQFTERRGYRINSVDMAVGITMFAFGLFKKVVLADNVATFATPLFGAAFAGEDLTLLEGWIASLAYTLQLYFDFSGYSDMAVGLARMFGIVLPMNFNSPYQAVSISDFWRRWHITLSRFLRDYLYIALGGNRNGTSRRYANLMITMVLGGLWHGAGWTFVFWGTLHGLYLVINHGWLALRTRYGWTRDRGTVAGRTAGWALTFLAVIVGWVFFRAASFDAAARVLGAMFGLNGIEFTTRIGGRYALAWIVPLLFWVWFMPNSQQVLAKWRPVLQTVSRPCASIWGLRVSRRLQWRPTLAWVAVTSLLLFIALSQMSRVSEFIYYQF